MLLLSLGPDLLAALLNGSAPRDFNGPDLSWLLFGPDLAALPAAPPDISEQIQAAE